ncbi:MAG: hypothetical protein U0Q16_27690 [Bryobacteraceae bacterium]
MDGGAVGGGEIGPRKSVWERRQGFVVRVADFFPEEAEAVGVAGRVAVKGNGQLGEDGIVAAEDGEGLLILGDHRTADGSFGGELLVEEVEEALDGGFDGSRGRVETDSSEGGSLGGFHDGFGQGGGDFAEDGCDVDRHGGIVSRGRIRDVQKAAGSRATIPGNRLKSLTLKVRMRLRPATLMAAARCAS